MRKAEPVKRARILDDDELRAIWKAAAANGVFGAYVRVCLLTGQRREKVASMRWEDIVDSEWRIEIKSRQKGHGGAFGAERSHCHYRSSAAFRV